MALSFKALLDGSYYALNYYLFTFCVHSARLLDTSGELPYTTLNDPLYGGVAQFG